LYYVLPRLVDIGRINHSLITGQPVTDWPSVWSTAAFGAVMMVISLILFARRDF
jgi:hypothetical protein